MPGLVWGLTLAAWLILEVLGLRRRTDRWPTFTDIVRRVRGDKLSPGWFLLAEAFLVQLLVVLAIVALLVFIVKR